MVDVLSLRESLDAHEQALQKVQLAMHREINPVARRELVTTLGRLVEKMESLRNRINRAMGAGAGVYVNF